MILMKEYQTDRSMEGVISTLRTIKQCLLKKKKSQFWYTNFLRTIGFRSPVFVCTFFVFFLTFWISVCDYNKNYRHFIKKRLQSKPRVIEKQVVVIFFVLSLKFDKDFQFYFEISDKIVQHIVLQRVYHKYSKKHLQLPDYPNHLQSVWFIFFLQLMHCDRIF